jgi:hypothetical protein
MLEKIKTCLGWEAACRPRTRSFGMDGRRSRMWIGTKRKQIPSRWVIRTVTLKKRSCVCIGGFGRDGPRTRRGAVANGTPIPLFLSVLSKNRCGCGANSGGDDYSRTSLAAPSTAEFILGPAFGRTRGRSPPRASREGGKSSRHFELHFPPSRGARGRCPGGAEGAAARHPGSAPPGAAVR